MGAHTLCVDMWAHAHHVLSSYFPDTRVHSRYLCTRIWYVCAPNKSRLRSSPARPLSRLSVSLSRARARALSLSLPGHSLGRKRLFRGRRHLPPGAASGNHRHLHSRRARAGFRGWRAGSGQGVPKYHETGSSNLASCIRGAGECVPARCSMYSPGTIAPCHQRNCDAVWARSVRE